MKVDVRAPDMPPAQLHEMYAHVRTAFRGMGQGVARVVVTLSAPAEKRYATRNCVIEVHMADGHVEYVEERQRRVGSALRRAVHRAWKAAIRWVGQQLPKRENAPPLREGLPVPVAAHGASPSGRADT